MQGNQDVKGKLLTISVAAYNTGSTIRDTLDSLETVSDAFDLLDIIIVDDGSTDATADIADSFAAMHSGSVRVIHKENGGYGSTINSALECAQGRYFKLLDAGDRFEPRGLRGLLEYLGSADVNNSADMILTPYICERRIRGKSPEIKLTDSHEQLVSAPSLIETADIRNDLAMFEICIKTELLRRSGIRFTEHCYYTDNEFVMTAELCSADAARYPEPVYRYILGVPGQSMSVAGRMTNRRDKFTAALGTFEIYRKLTADSPVSGTRKKITDIHISMMVREAYVACMLMDNPADYYSEIKEFDSILKEKMPEIYKISENSRLVRAVRHYGRSGFGILSGRMRLREWRRTDADAEPVWTAAAEYTAAACMIIQCRTVWMHLETYGMIVNRLCWGVMMLSFAVCLSYRGIKTDRKTFAICSGMIVYAGIFLAADPVNPLRVIRCCTAVLIMIVLAVSPGGKDRIVSILGRFKDIMILIATVSLVLWISSAVLHILTFTGYATIDWSRTGEMVSCPDFCNIYYETQPTDWYFISARNTAIFTESPMSGFCWSLALMTECLICGYRSRRRHMTGVIILTCAILSTLSLISYVFLLVLTVYAAVVRFLSEKHVSRIRRIIFMLCIYGMTAFVASLAWTKITKGSGSIRFNDFEVGYNAWLAHPLFGGGWENLDYLRSFMPEWRYGIDTGFSNSPMEILAQGGLWIGSAYISAFTVPFVRALRRRDNRMIIIIILWMFLFTFTVVPYQYITFFMLTALCSGSIDSKEA